MVNEYVPGVCNIGPSERAKRRMLGIINLLVAFGLVALFVILDVTPAWRLLIAFPVAGAASGFLQYAFHFCAGFGIKGIYNVVNSAGITDNVELEEFRRKDRNKALQISGLSVLVGILVAGLGYFFL